MSENNIETVAASDDRVTVYIDMRHMEREITRRSNILEIGHFLGVQGITDFREIDGSPEWFGLELSANDAMIVKLRFPIVSDSDVAAYHARLVHSTSTQPGMASFVIPSTQAAGLAGQSFGVSVGNAPPKMLNGPVKINWGGSTP